MAQLLSLPPELRTQILDHLLPHDLSDFSSTPTRPPALLSVSRQLRSEYGGIFYSSTQLQLDAYYSATDTWCTVANPKAKRAILKRARYVDLTDFWSLASARRFCQRVEIANDEGVQRGILTVMTGAAVKRWQWTTVRE